MTTLPAAVSQTVSLSSQLRAACEPRAEYAYDPDDERKGQIRQVWKLPERITEALKRDAAGALRQVEGALRPADPQTVRQWLTALGVMVAGQMTAADAKAKVGAYVPMLDHPASCFTRETLEEAGRAFKFFPSFSEVAAFLDSKADPLKTLRQRLEAVLRAPVTEIEKPAKRYSELTEAERAEVDAKFARAKAEARSRIVDEPAPTIKPIHIRSPELDAFVAAAKAKEPESV